MNSMRSALREREAVTEAAPRGGGNGRGRSTNQFQNFPQREIDYDALVLQQLTEK